MVAGLGQAFSADCVKLSASDGHSSSPKNEDVYTTVSPATMPLLEALPLTFCTAHKCRSQGAVKAHVSTCVLLHSLVLLHSYPSA